METALKTFDAVEMSRRLREQSGSKLWGMKREQRRAYLDQAIERYREEIRSRNQQPQLASSS